MGGTRHRWRSWTAVSAVIVIASCAGTELPAGEPTERSPTSSQGAGSDEVATSSPDLEVGAGTTGSVARPDTTVADGGGRTVRADISADPGASSGPFPRSLLGTNVPAWLGPDVLASATFQRRTVESGTTLLRMPGGSWSNAYDWLGCEVSDPARCYFIDSARPSDFIAFMDATGLPGMWTVSINDTAQSAAALVAFFNGVAGDDRAIGVDREGVDWGTVDQWARLRADGGHPEPVGLRWWEVGNEVFGGKPAEGGDECAPFGWEDVWTCDGAEYVAGDAEHDGYLAIREAMLTVDPSIMVGAVGVGEATSWSNWGREVVDGAAGALDFYVIHVYSFDSSPSGAEAIDVAPELWPPLMEAVRAHVDPAIPIAVTEYNLVAVESADTAQTMTRAMAALHLADTIGQMALGGVQIANQWNLANGVTGSGTDYGMIDLMAFDPTPQYAALVAWSRAADLVIPVEVAHDALRAYGTVGEGGDVALIVVNTEAGSVTPSLAVVGVPTGTATVESWWTDDLDATRMQQSSGTFEIDDGETAIELPPWSINVVTVTG